MRSTPPLDRDIRRVADREAASQRPAPAGLAADPARYAAAALAIVAGLIHFLAAPDHFDEAFAYGVAMLAIGAAQIVAGLLLLTRPSRPVVLATILGTLVVFLIYGVSRTTGFPFGPFPGQVEDVEGIDLVSKATELVLLLALVNLLRRGPGTGRPDRALMSRRV